MRSLRRHVAQALLLALVLSAVTASPAAAGAPSDQLKAQIDRVLKALDDPELKKEGRTRDRRAAVRKIANDIFDFGETARRSLGRHWQPRTPTERDEFVQLFADLLERSYISRVELYGGEKIQYLGDTVDGEQGKVQTSCSPRVAATSPSSTACTRRATGGSSTTSPSRA